MRFRFRMPRPGLAVCLALVAIGSGIAAYKISIVRPVRFVGHADSAAYATMGVHLAEGRGLQVDYVSSHENPYPPTITRREDHWPPFLGFAIAPFVLALGPQTWVCRLAPILIGSIGLPLAAAALGMAFSRRGYVGLMAGLLMMSNLPMFTISMRILSDIALAALVAAYCASLLGAVRRPWLHVVAGIFLGMSYYAKGAALVFILFYPAAAVVVGGFRVLRGKWFWLGVATVSVLITPWFASNWVLYGDPLHSTQSYTGGHIGLGGFERNKYFPYWGKNKPKTSDRWTKHRDEFPRTVAINKEALLRFGLMGWSAERDEWEKLGPAGAAARDWLLGEKSPARAPSAGSGKSWLTRWSEPPVAICGIITVLFLAALAGYSVLVLPWIVLWRRRRERSRDARSLMDVARSAEPPLLRPALALLLVAATYGAFLVLLWNLDEQAMGRYVFFALPMTAVVACTAVSRGLEFLLSAIRRPLAARFDEVATPILALAVVTLFFFFRGDLLGWQRAHTPVKGHPYVDRPKMPLLGDWIRTNLPNAIIMTRGPWELTFHSGPGNKAVATPWASPETVFAIARYYGVTHYLESHRRPALDAYTKRRHPGFRPVQGAPRRLFELRYEHLPGKAATATYLPGVHEPPAGAGEEPAEGEED